MKNQSIIVIMLIALLAGALVSCATTTVIPADQMGLSKGSVFAVPEQQPYQAGGGQPGTNKLLPRAYLNAPPQISHTIEDFLPITAEMNMCVMCHSQPGQWDKPRAEGAPTPIPRSHFTDLRNAPDKVTDHLMGARYNCNQCHVPQANAQPLVINTFGE